MKSWNEIRKNAAKCVAVVHCVIVGFSFNTETQRHKVSFPFIVRHLSSSSAPLLLCPSALKLFYRRVEIHFLILSILLILSRKLCAFEPLC